MTKEIQTQETLNLWSPERIHKILDETTRPFTRDLDKMPDGSVMKAFDSKQNIERTIQAIDVHFFTTGVDIEAVKQYRAELVALLNNYPDKENLAKGSSYISLGAEVEDQGMALRLMAVGKVLGFWELITPKTFGATGEQADALAGMGYVMISPVKFEELK